MTRFVGPERTLGAVIEVTSNMFQPGVVVRQTPPWGSWFGIGAFDASTRGRENEVGQCLRHAGTVEITDDIRSAKSMKLVEKGAEFLQTAIMGFPMVDAVAIPGIRRLALRPSAPLSLWDMASFRSSASLVSK